MNNIFPFTSIIGLELAKHSLIYHAIDPQLGGVLLMGHRGCAKSTIARAFREILPEPLNSKNNPYVEVPLGTSEDRLLGSIDPSNLLENGKWSAQKGLIEQANGGILYIDEVNLLPDHLVDSILDSASRGKHRIEREGLSKTVNARYVLIGSMNPEEGDLRPQLNDRFMHGIIIQDNYSVEERREIVRMRMNFDDDPKKFIELQQTKIELLKTKIQSARKGLNNVEISENLRTEVAKKAAKFKLEGVRAELGVIRTARCAAVWRGDVTISDADLDEAWILCLGHRRFQEKTESNNSHPEKNFNSSQFGDIKSEEKQISKTSFTPTRSNLKEIQLESAKNHAYKDFFSWKQKDNRENKSKNYFTEKSISINSEKHFSQLCWTSSLIASLKRGWSPGESWQLRFFKSSRRPNIWLFFDASRSTGAIRSINSTRFLEAARNSVLTLGSKTYGKRFHVLILQNGKIKWLIKRGTAQAFKLSLENLKIASGKSPLISALNQLRNSIQKRGVLEGDRVLLFSDGMLSPEYGKTLPEIKKRFRDTLIQLTKIISKTAWLHPQMQRGMRHWLPQIVKGTKISLFPLE